MLRTLDMDVQASDDEEYDLVIHVATGKLDVDGVRAWLGTRVRPFGAH